MPDKLIYELIPKVMYDIGVVGKGQTNTFDKYKFRGIDDVYNAVQPAFVKHGVFCVPTVLESHAAQRQTSQGKPTNYVLLTVRHTFYAPDGSSVDAITVGEADDRGDKAANKAMAAAFKYAIFLTLCIPTEGDNDSENHSHDTAATPAQPTRSFAAERQGLLDRYGMDACVSYADANGPMKGIADIDKATKWLAENYGTDAA